MAKEETLQRQRFEQELEELQSEERHLRNELKDKQDVSIALLFWLFICTYPGASADFEGCIFN